MNISKHPGAPRKSCRLTVKTTLAALSVLTTGAIAWYGRSAPWKSKQKQDIYWYIIAIYGTCPKKRKHEIHFNGNNKLTNLVNKENDNMACCFSNVLILLHESSYKYLYIEWCCTMKKCSQKTYNTIQYNYCLCLRSHRNNAIVVRRLLYQTIHIK